MPVVTAPFSSNTLWIRWSGHTATGKYGSKTSHFQTNNPIERIPSYSNVSIFSVQNETVRIEHRIRKYAYLFTYLKIIGVNAKPKRIGFAPFSLTYRAVWTGLQYFTFLLIVVFLVQGSVPNHKNTNYANRNFCKSCWESEGILPSPLELNIISTSYCFVLKRLAFANLIKSFKNW